MIGQHVKEGRRAAERLMVTTVTVTRTSGTPIFDEETGEYITPTVTVYDGKARIRQRNLTAADAEAAGQLLVTQLLTLYLPFTAPGDIGTGDVVTVTGNPLDPDLIGTEYRITGTAGETAATARRFEIERTSE